MTLEQANQLQAIYESVCNTAEIETTALMAYINSASISGDGSSNLVYFENPFFERTGNTSFLAKADCTLKCVCSSTGKSGSHVAAMTVSNTNGGAVQSYGASYNVAFGEISIKKNDTITIVAYQEYNKSSTTWCMVSIF